MALPMIKNNIQKFLFLCPKNILLKQFLFLLPYRATMPEVAKYISYQFGGLVLDAFYVRAILYAILPVIMLPFARWGFKKHQVA